MSDIVRDWLNPYLPVWAVDILLAAVVTTVLLLFAAGTMMLQVWVERRVIARFQDRIGPNRVGPAGLLQSVADGVKMFTKEDIVPRAADKWVHLLAPVITLAPVMLILAVLPWGLGLVPVDLDISVLYVAAVSSISGVGLMMAGWSSSNKFALLGAMRAVAQLVAYEIPLTIALLGVVLLTGGMSLARIPELQAGLPFVGTTITDAPDLGLGWFIFTPVGLIGFVIYYICVLSEGERTPFDIPEADSEIVAGYMTEYSGMKFAEFFLAQYVLNFSLSLVAAVVFLGGWQGPGVAQLAAIEGPVGSVLAGLLSLFYTLAKTWALFLGMVWLRGALPRLRADQLMGFAWKFLLPLALVNVVCAALFSALTTWDNALWGGVIRLDDWQPLARQILALVVTGIISVASCIWVLQLNQPERSPATRAAIMGKV